MRIPNVIYNYWDYGIIGMLILLAFPTTVTFLHNLNLAFWWIIVLCFVNELNGRKQAIKKSETYYMMDLALRKRRRPRGINERVGQWIMSMSIDQIAYVVFTVSVIVFFVWLVVFA